MHSPSTPLRRVLVITGDHALGDPTKWSGQYDEGDLALHQEMRDALERLPGYEFAFAVEHASLLDRLRSDRPDLVLNFCDTGFGNVATQELHVPALLELLGIPYTGAPPASMVLCYDKAVVRLIAEAHGIPVPREVYVPPHRDLATFTATYPALIKPALGDGSVGINRNAVVRSDEEARQQLAWFRDTLPGRTALVQEFLPGREFGMALVGNPGRFHAFPPLEVDFSKLADGLAPILAFESKTGPETAYGAVQVKQARLDQQTTATLRGHAEELFARLSCRDYARFDFRTAENGEVKLMEVNPNPAWSSAGKLALMAGFAGKGYGELLALILQVAEERVRRDAAGP